MANKKNNGVKHSERRSKNKTSHPIKRSGGARTSETALARRERDQAWAISPFSFIRRFGEEMDRLFDDFRWRRGWVAPTVEGGLDRFLGGSSWAPQVEVFEDGNKLVVRADLPGMNRDDVNV